MTISIIMPADLDSGSRCPLVIFNDGQDFERLQMEPVVAALESNGSGSFIVVGIHANDQRIFEYGTIAEADYAGRGNKAGATAEFVVEELIPFIKSQYPVKERAIIYAGFSLGGLMALDAVWNYPDTFAKAGVFSGALWWRRTALQDGYRDSDRIMHAQLREAAYQPGLQFWFQCGSMDETDDRDGDGVIDSIQDTLECVAELERKGYKWNRDVFYTEIALGEHNQETWSAALPAFFKWALSGLGH